MMTKDPWHYYLADYLDASARYWSSTRFISLLDSDSLEDITVLEVDRKDKFVELEIRGLCYDRIGSAIYDAYTKRMTTHQRQRLMLAIKNAYPAMRDPKGKTCREAARVLGCWSML